MLGRDRDGGRMRDRDQARWALAVWACLAVAAVIAAIAPDRAEAACPTRPADASAIAGTTVEELRALRQDTADMCAQLHDDLGTLDTGQTAVRGKLDAITAAAEASADRLAVIRDRLAGTIDVATSRGVTSAAPLYVQGQPAGDDEEPQLVDFAPATAQDMDDALAAINGAVYVLVGVTVIQLLLVPLLRRLLP